MRVRHSVSSITNKLIHTGWWQYNTGEISVIFDSMFQAGISIPLKFLEADEDQDKVLITVKTGKELV